MAYVVLNKRESKMSLKWKVITSERWNLSMCDTGDWVTSSDSPKPLCSSTCSARRKRTCALEALFQGGVFKLTHKYGDVIFFLKSSIKCPNGIHSRSLGFGGKNTFLSAQNFTKVKLLTVILWLCQRKGHLVDSITIRPILVGFC